MRSTKILTPALWRAIVIMALMPTSIGALAQPVLPTATLESTLAEPATAPDLSLRLLLDRAERMTIPVSIGSGPMLSFVVDTGAERSGVAIEIANHFGFERGAPRRVISFAGQQMVPTARLSSLSYARTNRIDVEALLFARTSIGADGFLGLDSLDNKRIDFDFIKRKMSIRHSPRGGQHSLDNAVVLKAKKSRGRMIFADAEVDHLRAAVVLDTGSSLTMGNAALRDRLRGKARLGKTIKVLLRTVTGEIVEADYGILREVTIGDVKIRRLPIAFGVLQPFDQLGLASRPAVLLGMDALQAFARVTVDFRDRSALFVARDDQRGSSSVFYKHLK